MMADDVAVAELLESWGLSVLGDRFVDNNIDQETFNLLNEADIKELIPSIGLRKKFLEKYNSYLMEKALIVSHEDLGSCSTTSDDTIDNDNASTSASIVSGESSSLDLNVLQPHYYPQKATLGVPYEVQCPTEFSIQSDNLTVANLLNSEEGQIIKNSYGPGKKFKRNQLSNLIIKNELRNNSRKQISTEKFKVLAQEVNDIFIHEDAAIYYLPYTKGRNGRVVAASGKLWSAYVYQRKLLRDAGILKAKSIDPLADATNSDNTTVKDEDITESLTWLQNNTLPYEEVSEKWRKTSEARLICFIRNGCETITDYYKKFPALKIQTGFLLLELDFNQLYQEKTNLFLMSWRSLSKPVYELIVSKTDSFTKEFIAQENLKFEVIDDDIKEVVALKFLPLLLQLPLITGEKHWKPSRKELLDGFILFVDDISSLSKKLEERQAKCLSLKLTAQPIPVIVGPYKHLQCFVSVNDS